MPAQLFWAFLPLFLSACFPAHGWLGLAVCLVAREVFCGRWDWRLAGHVFFAAVDDLVGPALEKGEATRSRGLLIAVNIIAHLGALVCHHHVPVDDSFLQLRGTGEN